MFGNDAFSAAPFSATGGVSDNVVVTLASAEATGFAGSVLVKGASNTSVTGAEVVTATTAATAKAGAVVVISGVSATGSTTDAVTVSGKAVFSISGVSASALTVGVIISGDALSFSATPTGLITSIGSVNATANADVAVNGFSIAANTNDVFIVGLANVSLNDAPATTTIGLVNARANADVVVEGFGIESATSGILDVVAKAVVPITLAPVNTSLGVVDIAISNTLPAPSYLVSTGIGIVNVTAEAVAALPGLQAVAITDDPFYTGDEVTVTISMLHYAPSLGLTSFAGSLTTQTIQFDYVPYTELYNRDNTVYLVGEYQGSTVQIPPKDKNNTIILTAQDRRTTAVVPEEKTSTTLSSQDRDKVARIAA